MTEERLLRRAALAELVFWHWSHQWQALCPSPQALSTGRAMAAPQHCSFTANQPHRLQVLQIQHITTSLVSAWWDHQPAALPWPHPGSSGSFYTCRGTSSGVQLLWLPQGGPGFPSSKLHSLRCPSWRKGFQHASTSIQMGYTPELTANQLSKKKCRA